MDLGHSLETVRVVYFAPIPGVLHARVCGKIAIGMSSGFLEPSSSD